MKKLSSLVAVLGFAWMATASAASGISSPSLVFSPVRGDDDNAPLTVQVGQEAVLTLDANPTTGYTWMVKSLPDIVILEAASYDEDTITPGMVGAGTTYTYRFIGQHGGRGTLELIYGRPWDSGSWQTRRIEIDAN